MLTRKKRIFYHIIYGVFNVDRSEMLPIWALCLRWLMFPLDSFYWWVVKNEVHEVYDLRKQLWNIHGMKFTDSFFQTLNNTETGKYLISNTEGVISITKLPKDNIYSDYSKLGDSSSAVLLQEIKGEPQHNKFRRSLLKDRNRRYAILNDVSPRTPLDVTTYLFLRKHIHFLMSKYASTESPTTHRYANDSIERAYQCAKLHLNLLIREPYD